MKWAPVVLLLAACTPPPGKVDDGRDAGMISVAAGCPVSGDGMLHSVGLDDGGVLLLFERFEGAENVGVVTSNPSAVNCLADLPALTPMAPADAEGIVQPLALVQTDGGLKLFFTRLTFDSSAFFGRRNDGTGVASWNETSSTFETPGTMLFTADRPDFGAAALVHEGFVYAFGCTSPAAFKVECYVARVPEADVANEAAYRFYAGGGMWSTSVDDAWPMVEAGTRLSVFFDETRGRFVMLYIRPLDTVFYVRSGLTPAGPWSREVPVARCERPQADTGAFCVNPVAHPALDADGDLAISYAITSFDRTAPESAYGLHLTRVALPELP